MPDLAPLKSKDGRFTYETAGDPTYPPLVFLHGIGGAARGWRGQLDFFRDRYCTIAWDMPGYGGSAPLTVVNIGSLAVALQDFLQQVGATKPILVGHSIGGMIVQQLLAKSPDIATAIVLAQTSPAFGRPDGDWQKSFLEARLGPLDRGETMDSLAPTLVKELVGNSVVDETGMALACDCMASVPEATYRATMLALMGFDQRDALKNIAVPTLVLSGSKDKNAPASMMARMATYIPLAKYVELNAGHLVNLERPAAFNAALDQFLKGQVAAKQVTA